MAVVYKLIYKNEQGCAQIQKVIYKLRHIFIIVVSLYICVCKNMNYTG